VASLVAIWDLGRQFGDLGGQFGDFGVPGCDELDSDSSEVYRRSENSAKLVPFRIRGPVK
jgi:hypothetical protein